MAATTDSPRPTPVLAPGPARGVEVVDLDVADDEQVLAWLRTSRRAFHEARRVGADELAPVRRRWEGQHLRAGTVGGQLVGTFRSWDVDLPVPGGVCRTDLVTSVTVAATHRRRGVLSAMMRADLREAAERRVPLALLVAAEAPIYGRFGFAPAVEVCTRVLQARPGAADLVPSADEAADGVALELVDEAALRRAAPAVYAEAAAGRPGAVPRSDAWWDTALRVLSAPGADADAAVHGVLARDGGGTAVGFARYRVTDSWEAGVSASVLHVEDMAATTPAADAALWRLLASTDLVTSVRAEHRPLDEPLPWLLRDRRAASVEQPWDLLWTRVLDPVAVLASRRAGAAGEGVLEVVDPGGPAAGRVAWRAAPDGTLTAEPTRAAADVELTVQALGSAVLGQVPLAVLAAAGHATEHRTGALAQLGAALAWPSTAAVTLTSF